MRSIFCTVLGGGGVVKPIHFTYKRKSESRDRKKFEHPFLTDHAFINWKKKYIFLKFRPSVVVVVYNVVENSHIQH